MTLHPSLFRQKLTTLMTIRKSLVEELNKNSENTENSPEAKFKINDLKEKEIELFEELFKEYNFLYTLYRSK